MTEFTLPKGFARPDPPKIEPRRPNLEGDDVMFARFDPETGQIISHGHMHRDHIRDEAEGGVAIMEHDRHDITSNRHRVHLATKRIVDHTPLDYAEKADDALNRAQDFIRGALALSDKYFLADAHDNITPAEQEAWRSYRKALRAAAKLSDAEQILAAVPTDPKGLDLAAPLRRQKAANGRT